MYIGTEPVDTGSINPLRPEGAEVAAGRVEDQLSFDRIRRPSGAEKSGATPQPRVALRSTRGY